MSNNCRHPTCYDSDMCRRPPKVPKKRTPLKRTQIKSRIKPFKEKEGASEQSVWFLERAKEMTGFCCNCGELSSARSGTYWKWSICHIMPKSTFPSVATHPLNFIECCISCHTLFDRSLSVAHTLKCWPEAVRKFNLFKNEIKESHKYLDLFIHYSVL
jgi:hypothetical protein